MKEILKKKGGFTLVEVLIVIALIGALSTLAINGYTSYRRAALLDLSVDSIVSQMYEMRDNTIHGDFGSERGEEVRDAIEGDVDFLRAPEVGDAKCYGLYFEKEGDGYDVVAIEQVFSNKKKSVGRDWVYEGCEDEISSERRLDLDYEMLTIEGINFDGAPVTADFYLRFTPPSGDFEAISVLGDKMVSEDPLEILIRYGVSEEDRYRRTLLIDLNTGKRV